MSNPQQNDQDADKPLSPEALAVLGKARRSFGISIGILLLGFMAIGFAIVYRVMRDAPPPAVAQSVSMPFHFEPLSAVLIDNTIQVTSREGITAVLSIFNATTGELIRTVNINPDRRPAATLESIVREREAEAAQ